MFKILFDIDFIHLFYQIVLFTLEQSKVCIT